MAVQRVNVGAMVSFEGFPGAFVMIPVTSFFLMTCPLTKNITISFQNFGENFLSNFLLADSNKNTF